MKITKRVVDGLLPGKMIWDSEIRGFGVRRQVNDRSYVLKCFVNGRQKWMTIGKHGSPWTPDSARKYALELLLQFKTGSDPAAERRRLRDQPTMDELCSRYLQEHAIPNKKPSSAESDRQLIKNHIAPLLGMRLVKDISKSDIQQFKDAVRDGKTAPTDPLALRKQQRGGKVVTGGRGVANRSLTLLSKIFNLAEDWGIREPNSNPVRRVPHYPEAKRERFLSIDELARLAAAMAQAENNGDDGFALAAIKLLVLTGARLGEIQSLRWEWVDLDRGLLLLPDSKTGKKSIFLSQLAVDVLQSLPRFVGNPFVIAGAKPGQALVNLQKPWGRIRKLADLSGVRLHDLRHTYASIALRYGHPMAVVRVLLGHASTKTTERYAHLERDHVWQASQEIGKVFDKLLTVQSPTLDPFLEPTTLL